MSKSPLEMLDACMIGPCVLVLYIYFGGEGILSVIGIHLPEYYMLVGIFVCILLLFLYVFNCIMGRVKDPPIPHKHW